MANNKRKRGYVRINTFMYEDNSIVVKFHGDDPEREAEVAREFMEFINEFDRRINPLHIVENDFDIIED